MALYTDHPGSFREEIDPETGHPVPPRDLVVPGIQNTFIAEVGSAELNGTFEDFKANIQGSQVRLCED